MDTDQTLRELREASAYIAAAVPFDMTDREMAQYSSRAETLAILFQALDEHLVAGGEKPEGWR